SRPSSSVAISRASVARIGSSVRASCEGPSRLNVIAPSASSLSRPSQEGSVSSKYRTPSPHCFRSGVRRRPPESIEDSPILTLLDATRYQRPKQWPPAPPGPGSGDLLRWEYAFLLTRQGALDDEARHPRKYRCASTDGVPSGHGSARGRHRRGRAVTARRTLIVGTGSIAAAHAAAVAGQGGRAAVVAGVDLQPARARDFAARHGIDYWSGDLAAALGQTWPGGGRLDLAHICTPPRSHVPLAVQCLRAGVPVLLEKPPALSLAQIDELLAVCESTGVDVAVVFQHRFGSGARRARALLAGGGQQDQGIGRPLVATCHTLWYRDADYFAVPWRGRWDVEGGGPTMGRGTRL